MSHDFEPLSGRIIKAAILNATGLRVGLLLNFNAPRLVIKRVVLGYDEAD